MKLDPKRTALLTLDFQKGILDMCPGADAVLSTAAKAAEFARTSGYRVIHVGLGFTEGHPEVSDLDTPFKRVRDNNLFVIGSPSAQFDETIVRPGELIVNKQRVGAFSENQLQLILRAQGIDTLVFFGVSTSGIVLSTLRRAFDLDFRSIIIADACFDPDEEVHRVLTEKVFPRQASVLNSDTFITEQTQ